jgi:hypothetical protein
MSSAIHIGNILDKDSLNNVAEAVEKIFDSGFRNHMDQKTIRVALNVFGSLTQGSSGSNITGCSFDFTREGSEKDPIKKDPPVDGESI